MINRLIWKSNEISKEWNDSCLKLKRLSDDINYEMLKRGIVEVDRYTLLPYCFDEQLRRITDDGFIFYPLYRAVSTPDFSATHKIADKIDSNSTVEGIITHSKGIAIKYAEALKNNDNIEIGRFHSYPDCCINFFNKYWDGKITDLCYESAINTDGYIIDKNTVEAECSLSNNILIRYFGFRAIQFFPCSYKCKEAIKLGNEHFKVLQSIDASLPDKLKYLLKQAVTWDLYKGIIQIEHPLFYGISGGYQHNRRIIKLNICD